MGKSTGQINNIDHFLGLHPYLANDIAVFLLLSCVCAMDKVIFLSELYRKFPLEKTNLFHNVFKVWFKCGNTIENCGSRVPQFFPMWN